MPEQEGAKFDWRWLLALGIVGIFGYVAYKLFGPAAGQKELLKIINEKWPNANDYLDRITTGGREPTEQEMNTYNKMVEDIITEEKLLPQPLIIELTDRAIELAKLWYLIPIAIFTPIAGYVSLQLFKDWHKNKCRRCQPPRCPKCQQYFATVEEMQQHIMSEHQPTVSAVNIAEAQRIFTEQPTFVGGTLAVAANTYDRTYRPWNLLNPLELLNLASGSAFMAATGWGSALTMANMRTIAYLLVI